MARAGAGHGAPRAREVVVAGEGVQDGAQPGVGHLVGQVQDEPEQLVRVAVAAVPVIALAPSKTATPVPVATYSRSWTSSSESWNESAIEITATGVAAPRTACAPA